MKFNLHEKLTTWRQNLASLFEGVSEASVQKKYRDGGMCGLLFIFFSFFTKKA